MLHFDSSYSAIELPDRAMFKWVLKLFLIFRKSFIAETRSPHKS